MKLEIETHDQELLVALMQTRESPEGSEVSVPGNATLRYLGKVHRTGVIPGMPEVLQFVLTFGKDILVSMVAAWLYEKLNQRAETVRIGKTRLAVRDSELKRHIEMCVQESDREHGDEEELVK